MVTKSDKKKTAAIHTLSETSVKYRNRIGQMINKTFGILQVVRFYDVHNGNYRFICLCTKCNRRSTYLGTVLRNKPTLKCLKCRAFARKEARTLRGAVVNIRMKEFRETVSKLCRHVSKLVEKVYNEDTEYEIYNTELMIKLLRASLADQYHAQLVKK